MDSAVDEHRAGVIAQSDTCLNVAVFGHKAGIPAKVYVWRLVCLCGWRLPTLQRDSVKMARAENTEPRKSHDHTMID